MTRELSDNSSGKTVRTGVIYNPRSHRNRGRDLEFECPDDAMMVQPAGREELPGLLREFADTGIETLVINGGDGTVRDVLSSGYPVFGDDWPTLCVLPKGKTNALNIDLDGPQDASLCDVLAQLNNSPRTKRRPIMLTRLDDGKKPAGQVLGFVLGAGNFTRGTRAAQDAHKAGAFNGLAVGLTIGWVMAQTLFGRIGNPWREGVRMAIELAPDGAKLAHSGHGDPARRALLLASTLQKFPVGMKPFGAGQSGLKLAVIDAPRRRIMAMLPALLSGYRPQWLIDAGVHQIETAGFTIAIEDDVIFDGEVFPAGQYRVEPGPELEFIVP